jgi:uncharacterized protein YjgD (DUF1641 family)
MSLELIDDTYVEVFYSNDRIDLEKCYNKDNLEEALELLKHNNNAGLCLGFNRQIYIFVFDKNKDTLVHELIHALINLNHFIGATISHENGEHNAYFIEKIYNKICEYDKKLK